MRRTFYLSTAEIIAVALLASQATAQIRQPDAFRTVAFEYDSYFTQNVPSPSPSPSDRVGAAQTQSAYAGGTYTPVAASAGAVGCGGSCGGTCSACRSCCGGLWDWLPDGHPCFGSCLACCNDGTPWRLLDHCEDDAWSVGGWFNGGVLTNDHGHWNNGPVPFISTNDLLMNQAWFYAEKETNTDGCGWDFGGRIDYVFGADGPDTQAFGDGGWDFGWNSGGEGTPFHTYGSAIPQLYATVAHDNLTVKIGRFFTIIGYEVVSAPDNFFYTHAYTMNYGEPFTHTGVLGEYAYSDCTTIYGGYVTGWDSGWENLNEAHMVLGGVGLAWWQDASLTYAFIGGDNGTGLGDLYMHSLVFDYQLTDRWNYVLQSDFGVNYDVPGFDDAHWYGLNSYLFYTLNDCWSAGTRVEWFRDEDGARIGGFASRGNYYAATLGLNYKPNANVIIRPEVRYDWFEESNATTAVPPFAGGTEDEQLMTGVDFIFLY